MNQTPENKRPFTRITQPILVVFVLLMVLLRFTLPERNIDDVSPRAWFDVLFVFLLFFSVLMIAGVAGIRILGLVNVPFSGLEKLVWAIGIGLGFVANGVFLLGLIGLLKPLPIFLWLAVVWFWTRRERVTSVSYFNALIQHSKSFWRKQNPIERCLIALGALVMVFSFIQALTPPWDYDGLMYHLEGPRQFLGLSRIILLPDLWAANGPFLIEMLFTIGLAFGSEVFARLVHWLYSILLILVLYHFSRKFLSQRSSLVAVCILIGIPTYSQFAHIAYIDISWAYYEFLGFLAFFYWISNLKNPDKSNTHWLTLSAIASGFALATKYISIAQVGILAALILVNNLVSQPKESLKNLAIFLGLTALIASPWYLKNWILGGNPFYPLFFGGVDWPSERIEWLATYLNSFGLGVDLGSLIALPWNIYAQNRYFTTFLGDLDIPSILFPLLLLLPGVHTVSNKKLLGLYLMARLLAWVFSSQQTRFLLPAFPLMCFLTAAVLERLDSFMHLGRRIGFLSIGMSGSLVIFTLYYSMIMVRLTMPLGVITGVESKAGFLSRVLPDFAAISFINDQLPPNARVLFLWDGQGYYCHNRCLADTEQSRWSRLAWRNTTEGITEELNKLNITHLLYSKSDAEFILDHDPFGKHLQAHQAWLRYSQACTKEIFQANKRSIYERVCH
jgi:hypothetical protein